MSKIHDHMHVTPIYDATNGRRFQITVTNPEAEKYFSINRDVMCREYVKLKLSEADIMNLIQQLQKNLTGQTETRVGLTLIPGSKED